MLIVASLTLNLDFPFLKSDFVILKHYPVSVKPRYEPKYMNFFLELFFTDKNY